MHEEELIQEHKHKVLPLPTDHCHIKPIELVWSQAKRYYNSSFGLNGFWMEAVTNMWEESQLVCFLWSLATR